MFVGGVMKFKTQLHVAKIMDPIHLENEPTLGIKRMVRMMVVKMYTKPPKTAPSAFRNLSSVKVKIIIMVTITVET